MRRHHRRQLRHHRRHDLDEHDGRHGDCISTASSPTLGSISCYDIFATLTQSCTSSSCWNGTTCLDGTTLTRRHIPIWTIPRLRRSSSRLEGNETNPRRTSTATMSSSFVGARTTNHGHEMSRNYKIYSGTCVYASRGTCHGMHASGMSISAARGGAAGGSRDMNTERDPQELDTSWQQLAQDSGS